MMGSLIAYKFFGWKGFRNTNVGANRVVTTTTTTMPMQPMQNASHPIMGGFIPGFITPFQVSAAAAVVEESSTEEHARPGKVPEYAAGKVPEYAAASNNDGSHFSHCVCNLSHNLCQYRATCIPSSNALQ